MMSQVVFYGTIQKAQMLLGCVQASIEACRVGKRSYVQQVILDRYAAELESIEHDLFVLIDCAEKFPGPGNQPPDEISGHDEGTWPGRSPDRDVHDV